MRAVQKDAADDTGTSFADATIRRADLQRAVGLSLERFDPRLTGLHMRSLHRIASASFALHPDD